MSPEQLLHYLDQGQLWSAKDRASTPTDLAAAYQQALAVRQLRLQRGERPRGYKIGFTNRTIWPIYDVYAPIWGTVWDSGLHFCEGEGEIDLAATCQPRLEPEIVFGFGATPVPDASPQQLFDAIEWLATEKKIDRKLPIRDWKPRNDNDPLTNPPYAGFRQPRRAAGVLLAGASSSRDLGPPRRDPRGQWPQPRPAPDFPRVSRRLAGRRKLRAGERSRLRAPRRDRLFQALRAAGVGAGRRRDAGSRA
mgnify:CR=1 FL=1